MEGATELLEHSASSWRKEALKADGLALKTRTRAEGTTGGNVERGVSVKNLACFPGSLPSSRVVWQVRGGCGPRQDGEDCSGDAVLVSILLRPHPPLSILLRQFPEFHSL